MGKQYCLFIGRFQPFHKGHKKLMETQLEKGKNVLVALRDTGIDEDNPFTIAQRKQKIRDKMEKWIKKGMLKITVIPDIEAVCYGREVGYDIREIRLDEEIESISATEIREKEYL